MFCWMTIPHRTASTGLSKIARKPSPVVLTLDPFYTAVRSFLIDLHEAAVTADIAGDNRGKAARHCLARRLTTGSARFDIANFSHEFVFVSLDCKTAGQAHNRSQ
jgi:hypothetical protein